MARFDAGRHLSLAAFDEYWGGRPFLDSVEIEMGRATREQFVDLQMGKADVIELAPNEMRTAAERGTKTWMSAPVELLALFFGPGRASDDARLREALALSIDRTAIHNVLLQRQGVITGALLPQWLSGYAFLFPTAMDLARARQLVAEVPSADRTLPLAYDAADPQARILAERIAVNARDAGITLQVTNQPRPELRLVRARFSSLDAPSALAELSAALGLGDTHLQTGRHRPEALYTAERALLEGFRVVPLFHLPDVYGVGAKVQNMAKAGRRPPGLAESRRHLPGDCAMTFRTRLLALFILVIAVAVGVVTAVVSTETHRAFERMDNDRSAALDGTVPAGVRCPAQGSGAACGGHCRSAFHVADGHRFQPSRAGLRALRRNRPGTGRGPGTGFSGTGGQRRQHHLVGAMAGALRIQGRVGHRSRGRLEAAGRVSRPRAASR